MTGYYKAFDLDDLERKQADSNQPYFEFLRRRAMSAGLYTLRAGGEDHQHPHAADELYHVLQGRGTLQVGDQRVEVRPGSLISVEHGEDHRFVEVTEDLRLVVIFAPPEESPED